VFDTNKQVTIKIVSGGVKQCDVRFPTDQEWCERTRRQKIVRQQVTGGKFRTDVLNAEKSDAELLNKIRMDDKSVSFSDAEASKVISRLESCEIIDSERDGDGFCITIKAMGSELKHRVRIPMEDETRKFSRSAQHPLSTRRLEETTVSLEPSGDFYDKIIVSSEGYADGKVPIIHKDVIVVETLHQVRRLEDELDPEG
jgi:hypothetical protein